MTTKDIKITVARRDSARCEPRTADQVLGNELSDIEDAITELEEAQSFLQLQLNDLTERRKLLERIRKEIDKVEIAKVETSS